MSKSTIEMALTLETMRAFQQFCREPSATIDSALEWLKNQGHEEISRSAVGRWKQQFDEREQLARIRERSIAAARISEAIEEASPGDLNHALLTTVQRQLLEYLMSDQPLDPDSAVKLGATLKSLAGAETQVRELIAKQKAVVEAAERDAATGKSAVDVVSTIKQALGIAA